jgi:hypothetical protein
MAGSVGEGGGEPAAVRAAHRHHTRRITSDIVARTPLASPQTEIPIRIVVAGFPTVVTWRADVSSSIGVSPPGG